MRKLFLTILLLVSTFSFAQNKQIDSLKNILKTAKQDTLRVRLLAELSRKCEVNEIEKYAFPCIELAKKNIELKKEGMPGYKRDLSYAYSNLGYYYKQRGDIDTAISHYLKSLSYAQEAGDKQQVGKTLSNIATVYFEQADNPKALEYYFKGLKIAEEVGDKQGVGRTLGNIGAVYAIQADYPKALEYYLKGLKISEEVGDKQMVGRTLGNIAGVYRDQADYPKALEYFLKGLKLSEEVGDKQHVGITLGNIAIVYKGQADYPKVSPAKADSLRRLALEYCLKGLKIAEELGDKRGIGRTLGNIGGVYKEQSDYPRATEYYIKSLKIAEEVDDKIWISYLNTIIGFTKIRVGAFKEAESYLKRGLEVAIKNGLKKEEKDNESVLVSLYEKTNRPALAFEHYKKYIALRDTIFSEENTKKLMRSEMDHQYEKEKLVTDAKHQKEIEKQNAIAEEKNRKQKVISLSVGVGLVLVLILALFIYRSNRQKQKANHIITLQKKEVESQKHLIEEKHKEITDSINYAERIQRSFLASKEMLDENLSSPGGGAEGGGGYFVYFQPKDVVSGDFYWATKLVSSSGVENFALVTADSTGHGVPGAIMSLLNITSLESAIKDGHTQPADILNDTRKTIINRLKKDGSEQGGKDGMDASLICFDFANNKLSVAAANNPVWIVRGSSLSPGEVRGFDSAQPDNGIEVIEIKADKMPVGKHDKDNVSFTQQEIQLQKGDVVYTLTDGFPDQFGGKKSKKFMSKNLRELLAANAHLPMQQQKQLLEKTFTEWKGNLEQVDDVCVIGVRV